MKTYLESATSLPASLQKKIRLLLVVGLCITSNVYSQSTIAKDAIKQAKSVKSEKYDYKYPYSEGLAIVELKGKFGYVDEQDNIVVNPIYFDAKPFSQGFAFVYNNYQRAWAVINKKGEVLTAFEFGIVKPFSAGRAVVYKLGKYGYIDTTGKIVIEPKFDVAYSFTSKDSYAVVGMRDNMGFVKYGTIMSNGQFLIEPEFDYLAEKFDEEGYIVARKYRDGDFYFASTLGKERLTSYTYAEPFSEGLALIGRGKYPDTKYGFIDSKGKMVVEPTYSSARSFKNGFAWVCQDKKWGLIDKTGNEVIPLKYEESSGFVEGLALVKLDGKYGFIDSANNAIIPFRYQEARIFKNGFALVKLNGKWGVINQKGQTVIPFKYDEAGPYSNGYTRVGIGPKTSIGTFAGKWGYINDQGQEVIPVKFEYATEFIRGFAKTFVNGKYVPIDRHGRLVTETK